MNPQSIANEVIRRLRAEGLDAFRKGGCYDVSHIVREVIIQVINERRNLKVAPKGT